MKGHAYIGAFPVIYFIKYAPTDLSPLQVTQSWPLIEPQFFFPGAHLSFTVVINGHAHRGALPSLVLT
jgi:hypothetical protein